MADTGKIVHPQHFGTDPTVIQIRINPATQMEFQMTSDWNFGIGGGLHSRNALVVIDLTADRAVEFYLYPTVGTVLIHSAKPELTE